ncbi:MAG: hypothetical protein AB1306_09920 [Nitrospirota bacterium]
MSNRLNEILTEIRELEKSVQEELKRREEELKYKVRKGRVTFEHGYAKLHKKLSRSLLPYVFNAPILTILSTPVIYSMIIPAVLMDLGITIYQAICFPIYGIPKVERSDHIILDRHYLKYLNFLERLNCDYCSYFNGLASYITEIGARSEQYWCPIKHASGNAQRHSRYHKFFDYGDADAYSAKLKELRKELGDTSDI